MSGAALLVGPYLVGILVADPGGFRVNRLVAVPANELLNVREFRGFFDSLFDVADPVGSEWRLEYAAGRSLRLAAPYRPLPTNFKVETARIRLLHPEHRVVPFTGRTELIDELVTWCAMDDPGLALRTVSGPGAPARPGWQPSFCVMMTGKGWDAGFADLDRPGGTVRWTSAPVQP
jgi:hypothetical protein